MIKTGYYKHYKGSVYKIIGISQHTETEEFLVLYHKDGDDKMWARPITMFFELVDYNGEKIPRFRFIRQ